MSSCNWCGQRVPTPEEIAARAAEIRAKWTARVEASRRAGGVIQRWEVPCYGVELIRDDVVFTPADPPSGGDEPAS